MPPPFYAVTFDLDGVLADSEAWWNQIDAKLLAEYGVKYCGEYHQNVVGVSYRIAVEFYKKAFGLSVATEEMMRRRGEDTLRALLNLKLDRAVLELLLGDGVALLAGLDANQFNRVDLQELVQLAPVAPAALETRQVVVAGVGDGEERQTTPPRRHHLDFEPLPDRRDHDLAASQVK